MKFDEIKTQDDFVEYMKQRNLDGVKDDVTIEMCRNKRRELELPTSILKMHYDLQKIVENSVDII